MGGSDQDDRLLAQAGRGDANAFEQLVERHADRVFSLARNMLGSHADAEEVAQEVFLTVWRQAPEWRAGKARFTTWLHRVTMNQSLNHRQRVATRHEALELVAEPPDPSPLPEESLDEDRRRAHINRALAGLPEAQRTAMTLTYGNGLANAEAAAAMGISVKALEALLVRARRRLREVMGAVRGPIVERT